MTKDVLVSISGLQVAANVVEEHGDEPIEIVTVGTYYFKDGKRYIFFEEVAEGFSEVTKTQIRLCGTEILEVIKRGVLNTHLIFDRQKVTQTLYRTPFGDITFAIQTTKLLVCETDEKIVIQADYVMLAQCEPLANCSIKICVQARES